MLSALPKGKDFAIPALECHATKPSPEHAICCHPGFAAQNVERLISMVGNTHYYEMLVCLAAN